ncbi:MAG: DNA integrity scanning protein DisA nucleotide-binding domain protein, partial [Clostridia bacterium]|nr:DNA integrity scanning protein DisA nucleotide-binding domain protein [Clostridia bacterium]
EDLHKTILRLSRRRVGALIVFEQKTGLGDIISTGTAVEGLISGALIENIFEPNTPLHDGAVICRGTTLVAAACFLPLSEETSISRELGTRHRAALGVSTVSDCIALVVSEETGAISMAQDGKLIRYLDSVALRHLLESIFLKKGVAGLSFGKNHSRRKEEK